jgi:hypothetical protein
VLPYLDETVRREARISLAVEGGVGGVDVLVFVGVRVRVCWCG